MAISPLWPKPAAVADPARRRRSKSALGLAHAAALHPASVGARQRGRGAAQRYVRLAQTRRTARTWQLNTGAAAMHTRYGPGISIPTDYGAEIEALVGSNPSFAAWEQNEPYRSLS
jgi:hypothetical protein